ncbi:Chromate resistance protein ChrB [Streptomyces regalis]|uniref:Chromate resistance protein ChrB n=1 Tax=Streptomyces regalis TaxID=68262 RepID=UPI000ABD0204|nr:Chromate resistance protein ChrB [Streptomyces regalis]
MPVFGAGIARALELTERAGGEAVSLTATGRGVQDGRRLRTMFTAARSADWAEFLADCGKFERELARARGGAAVGCSRIAKFTLAELEEEQQSLERLRRWHRDLTARDVFGAPESAAAGERLKGCVAACEDYAERVFAALHQAPEHGMPEHRMPTDVTPTDLTPQPKDGDDT